jgi:ribonuclease HII
METMMVCGIDEAGRGPLAGPVVAAAVVLGNDLTDASLADSKILSEAERTEAESVIRRSAAAWGISCAWPDEIDRLNIHWATFLAMQRAFAAMNAAMAATPSQPELFAGTPDPALGDGRGELTEAGVSASFPTHRARGGKVLVDGRFTPELPWPARAVVGGDRRVPEIQAASILAKTARDRWMIAAAQQMPGYGFERHKGYPTVAHRRAISELGPSPIHRRSFRLIPSASSGQPG